MLNLRETELLIIVACAVFIAAAVTWEHRHWAHLPELVRRGIGGLTVLIPAFPLVLLGILDLLTYLAIFGFFVVAGGILAALVLLENPPPGNDDNTEEVKELRRKIHKLGGRVFWMIQTG